MGVRRLVAAGLVAGTMAASPAIGTPARATTSPHGSAPRLSLQQLAGQRVIYSYRGLTPPLALLRAIRGGRAAGVVFFGDNISSRSQIRAVIAELQRAAAHSPVRAPLMMMTDQEGGLVRRLPG